MVRPGGIAELVVQQAAEFRVPDFALGGEQGAHSGLVVFQRHVIGADADAAGVVDRIDCQLRIQLDARQLPPWISHLQHGGGRHAQMRRQDQARRRPGRRSKSCGERRADAVAAVVVPEPLHLQVHRRHEGLHPPPARGLQAGLVDRDVQPSERQFIPAALQRGGALGAFAAEHLGQRQIVKIVGMHELRAVRARPIGRAGGKQDGVGVEGGGQQHGLGFRPAAFLVVQLRQGVEVAPLHPVGDGLRPECLDGGGGIGVEAVEQRGAAQDGARGLAELVAGEGGSVDLLVGGTEIDAGHLHRRAAGGEGEEEDEQGADAAEERDGSGAH